MITAKSSGGKGRFLPLLLVVALAIQVWLLVSDLRPSAPRADAGKLGSPIAELVDTRRTVKTQDPGALIWNEIPSRSPLYRKQSLLTADEGRAEIAFLDGAGLIVGPNTWVQIERDESSSAPLVVRLVRGQVGTKKGGSVKRHVAFRVGNAQVIPSADAEISLTSDGAERGGEVQVRSGSVEFRTTAGTATASAGEEAPIDPISSDRAPVPRKAPFMPLSPSPEEWIRVEEPGTIEVAFQWKIDVLQVSDSPMQLEVSRDATFARDVRTGIINATYPPMEQARLGIMLPLGEKAERWYWRVRALRRALVSPAESFLLGPGARPALRLPEPESRVREGAPVEFVWEALEGALDYEIEVTPPQGDALRASVARTLSRLGDLKTGRYQWRVRAKLRDGSFSAWSSTSSFTVAPSDSALPPPSQLHEPEFEAPRNPSKPRSSWWNWLIAEAWAQEVEDPTFYIRLGWDPVPGAMSYRLQLSRRSSFGETFVNLTLKETQWTWPYQPGMENTAGRVFYRVASIGPDGKQGPFSDARPISIPEAIRARSSGSPSVAGSPAPEEAKPQAAPASADEPSSASTASVPMPRFARATLFTRALASVQNVSQSGLGAGGESVQLADPFLSPRLHFSVRNEIAWADLELAGSRYIIANPQERVEQPRLTAIEGRLTAAIAAKNTGLWRLHYGGTIERGTRWLKATPQVLENRGTFALGPYGSVVRVSPQGETGLRVALPLTGLILGGQYGIHIAGWREWRFLRTDDSEFGLRVGAEWNLRGWSSPDGASTRGWALTLGPVWQRSLY